MADFTALKTAIQTYIKQNGNEEITGNILQEVLLSMVQTMGDGAINDLVTDLSDEVTARQNADTTLGNSLQAIHDAIDNGYVYAGIATPTGTPVSGKVFYLAVTAGTYTNFGGLVVTPGISILKYNGTSWVKEQVLFTDCGVFDISAYHATGGTLATYADLAAALNGGANIPQSLQKGGMSVKFVQTSDNKYVQCRLMAQNFTSDVTQWQGVDDEPTAESNNLVKSDGVYSYGNSISQKIFNVVSENNVIDKPVVTVTKGNQKLSVTPNFYLDYDTGAKVSDSSYSIYSFIAVSDGIMYVTPSTYAGRKAIGLIVYSYDNQGNFGEDNVKTIYYKKIGETDLPGTLPLENSPASVKAGDIVCISIHNNFDFGLVTDISNFIEIKYTNIAYFEGYNKFNPKNTVDSYINTGGNDDFNQTSLSTTYIDIPDGETRLVFNNMPTYTSEYSRIVAFYDINKNYLSRVSIGSSESERVFDIPSNAKFFRASIFVLYNESRTFDNIFMGFDENHKDNTYKQVFKSINGLKEKLPTFDKTLVIFGDSRVETASMNDDGTNYVEGTKRNYPMYLPELLQLGEMRNFALSGAAYRYRGDHYAYRQEISNQILCAIANGVVPDIVIIDAGTNDANGSLAAHSHMTYDETMALSFNQLSLSEWLNAVRWAYEKVKTTWKNAICFAITPTQRADMWSDEVVKAGLRPVVCKGIAEMGQTFDFVVIDAFAESNICYVNETWEDEGTYLSDGLHPNENGMKRLADYVSAKILSYYKDEK